MKLKHRNRVARLIDAGMTAHANAAQRVLRLKEISAAIDAERYAEARALIREGYIRLSVLKAEHPGWGWLEGELARCEAFIEFEQGDETGHG